MGQQRSVSLFLRMWANDSDRQTLDLIPFWKSESGNAFHRSTDAPVRDWLKFRFTYPEFVGLEKLSDAERKARIQGKVDALYDPNNRRQGIPTTTRPLAAMAGATGPLAAMAGALSGAPDAGSTRATAGQQPGQATAASGAGGKPLPQAVFRSAPLSIVNLPTAPTPTDDASELTALQRLDWFIRIRVKKFQLKQSFTILVFLGSIPEDVEDWRTSPNLIGSHSEFVNSDPEHCANCKENADAITEGFIDLDDGLERMGLGHKTEEEIENYIKDNIHWRIQKVSRHHRLPLMAGADRLLARSMERLCLLQSLRS